MSMTNSTRGGGDAGDGADDLDAPIPDDPPTVRVPVPGRGWHPHLTRHHEDTDQALRQVDDAVPALAHGSGDFLAETAPTRWLVAERYLVLRPILDVAGAYLARDEVAQQEVFLKVRPPAELPELAAEAQAIAASASPYLAAVGDVRADEACAFVAYRLPVGRPLDQVVAEEGPLPPVTLLRVMTHLLGALEALHRGNHVHGGVTPGHVWIGRDHRLLVCGLASPVVERPPLEPPDVAYDLADAARIFTALALGRFVSDDEALRVLPEAQADVVCRAVYPDDADRFESAAALRLALFALDADGEPEPIAGPRPDRARTRMRKLTRPPTKS